MGKIIFELMDYKESPNSEPKLNIEVRFEPLRQTGKAKELAEYLLDSIDAWKEESGGVCKVKDVKKY